MMKMLFRPFDLGRWFIIGFAAWLAQLGQSGGGFNFNPGGGGHHNGGNLQNELGQAKDYVLNNLGWIIPLVIGVVVVMFALWLLITWLNSRGKFMFLHCVAWNRAEVAVPWRSFAAQGNSLFWFRVVLAAAGLLIFLPLIAAGVMVGFGMVEQSHWDTARVIGLAVLALVLIGFAILFALVGKLTADFVVPIMMIRRCTCLAGWRILRTWMGANLGRLILYLLFQIVIAMVTGTLVLFVAVITCCACCLLLVPYISSVILLPVSVFLRAYSAHYLAQYGPDFDVFGAPAPTA